MDFKNTYGVPCEGENCKCKKTYEIKINGYTWWLCKFHMKELLNNLQDKVDKISE